MPGMPRLDLAWWPPDPDEPIGEERARELVSRLRAIVGPVVDAAETDLRRHIGAGDRVRRSGAPVRYLATARLSREMRSLCVGTVSHYSGELAQNSIQVMRDGTVTWRRE